MQSDAKIWQATLSAGASDIDLQPQKGCRSFYAAFGQGGHDVFLYMIRHRRCNEWEVGTGHLSDAATLVRDTVVASSNADAPVLFSPGVKDVINNIYELPHDAAF